MATPKDEDKVGLTSEKWLKLWDDGFMDAEGEHEHCHHEHGDSDHHQRHQEHSEDHHHHGNETDKEYEYGGEHGCEVDKYLKKHLNRLTGGNPNSSILVTLCGNSPDLPWLCEQGHTVVGCEISERAVKQLFENKVLGGAIPFEVTQENDVKVYSATDGKKLKVYVGDFFGSLSPDLTGTFDCIWDSHGIVSIPVPLHAPFAEKVVKFLKPGGQMLFSTVDYDITMLKSGPAPCPIPTTRLKELFPDFEVELLDEPEMDPADMDGLDRWTNPFHLLTYKMAIKQDHFVGMTHHNWLQKWDEGSLGWHREQVDAILQKYLKQLTGNKESISVLVTLCGKSLDLPWLCDQGHSVIGCELSEIAGKQLFEENSIPYTVTTVGDFKVFSATEKKLKFYAGDFFKVNASLIGTFDAIWDHHALGAINPNDRSRYVEILTSLLVPHGKILLSNWEYDQSKRNKPPYSLNPLQIKEYFEGSCEVKLLERMDYNDSIFTKKFNLDWGYRPIHLLTLQ